MNYRTPLTTLALAAALIAATVIPLTGLTASTSWTIANAPWTTDERVNTTMGEVFISEPSIAVDQTGNTYVIWYAIHETLGDVIYFRHRNSGGEWGSEEIITTAPLDIWSLLWPAVDIAVDSAGNVYAVWNDARNGTNDIFFSYRPKGGSWSPVEQVSDAPRGAQCNPSIAVDGSGNAYVVWLDYRVGNSASEDQGDIYFSYRPAGGSWSASVRVTDDDFAMHDHFDPKIAVDSAGNAHAIWIDGRNTRYDIYYSYRAAGGSWQTNQRVNDGAGTAQRRCDIAVDGSGSAYAVWADRRGGDTIYFGYRPREGAWQVNERVNSMPDSYSPAIAVGNTGNAYVLWSAGSEDYDVYSRFRTTGGVWDNEVMVNDSPSTLAQMYCNVDMDGAGNAYAVWFDKRNVPPPDYTYGDVYFSSRSKPVLSDLSSSTKRVSASNPAPGDRVTYTLSLHNIGESSAFTVTDSIPVSTTYVTGSAYATHGQISDAGGITWTGMIDAHTTITALFAVTVSTAISEPTAIVNEATIQHQPSQVFTVKATMIVNGYLVHLPVVYKGP